MHSGEPAAETWKLKLGMCGVKRLNG